VIAVTHDRYFLDNAAEWILELDRGYGIPWKGNYSSWLEQKEARLETEAKQEAARIKAMKHELEWVRQNPKGRQAKSKQLVQRLPPANTETPGRDLHPGGGRLWRGDRFEASQRLR
jgi:sulfate-transporting ATPase